MGKMFLKIKGLSQEESPYVRVQRAEVSRVAWEVEREFIRANSRKRSIMRDCSNAKCYRSKEN